MNRYPVFLGVLAVVAFLAGCAADPDDPDVVVSVDRGADIALTGRHQGTIRVGSALVDSTTGGTSAESATTTDGTTTTATGSTDDLDATSSEDPPTGPNTAVDTPQDPPPTGPNG